MNSQASKLAITCIFNVLVVFFRYTRLHLSEHAPAQILAPCLVCPVLRLQQALPCPWAHSVGKRVSPAAPLRRDDLDMCRKESRKQSVMWLKTGTQREM